MRPLQLVITDSGLGGLAVCAGLERAVRDQVAATGLRLTYVNAWPEEGRGYNDLPDLAARAAAFDRALSALDGLSPDLLVIACNTLSIVHEHTAHRRRAPYPVQGIVDAGVDLFVQALRAKPASSLVLLGTRTTIDSGVHARRLIERGVDAARIGGASCHGLATAIETAPSGPATNALLDTCARRAAAAAGPGSPLLAGLCCTHYGLVADRLSAAIARHAARPVEPLDPNGRMVRDIVARLSAADILRPAREGVLRVQVVSKVVLPDAKRRNVAELLEPVSPATARALRDYTYVPALF